MRSPATVAPAGEQAGGEEERPEVAARGAWMLQVLQDAGFRLTPARRAVVEVLQRGGHKSAPEIVAEVKRRYPGVGRASVYRTLSLLSRLCALQSSLLGTAQAHYAAADGGHHHHFICDRCGYVIEVDRCVAGPALAELERELGVRVRGHLLEFYGLCRTCAGAI